LGGREKRREVNPKPSAWQEQFQAAELLPQADCYEKKQPGFSEKAGLLAL